MSSLREMDSFWVIERMTSVIESTLITSVIVQCVRDKTESFE